jgi:hypothetical protein
VKEEKEEEVWKNCSGHDIVHFIMGFFVNTTYYIAYVIHLIQPRDAARQRLPTESH